MSTAAGTALVPETIERVLKPIQQFVRGWMMSRATLERGSPFGLDPNTNHFWIVGRAGVMGDCTPEVAAGGLGFLGPDMVRAAWEAVPDGVSHLAVASEYARCCTDWGRAELARFDPVVLDGVDRMGRRIADAVPLSMGGVFAGWRALDQPQGGGAGDVGARVALTMHLLRELRGAAHIAAVLAVGITPLDAVLASPAVPPRTGPPWAEHLGWTGPFRNADEVRAARLEAEALTSRMLVPYFSVLDEAELGLFADTIEATRNAIDM